MSTPCRAIVLRGAPPPSPIWVLGQLRLSALLRELARAEAEVRGLTSALAGFEAAYRAATEVAFRELADAERLLRRAQALEAELARLSEGPHDATSAVGPGPGSGAGSRVERARRGPSESAAPRAAAGAVAARGTPAQGVDLKTLYRMLARLLHPDLTRGTDAERARRSELMAQANDAYARGDRPALELLAERLEATSRDGGLVRGSGPVAGLDEDLARRIAAVEDAVRRARGDLARLSSSTVAGLRDESRRRAGAGGDFLAEAREAAQARSSSTLAEAMATAVRLAVAARDLGRVRNGRVAGGGRRRARGSSVGSSEGGAGSARPRTGAVPPRGSRHVRAAARRGGRRGAAAQALARWLERAAVQNPWQAGLTLAAFLAEEVDRPAAPLGSLRALHERWELMRTAWPDAPALDRALAAAPPHLELGLRRAGDELRCGVQLISPGLASGVRLALRRAAVRRVARVVLSALGPRLACERCGDVLAVHVPRLTGVDEVHALACPSCGANLRSYLRFGPAEGLEGLAGVAIRAGVIDVVRVRLGRARLALGMLPSERARLTAADLLTRFHALCLAPHQLHLPPGALGVKTGKRCIDLGARVPRRGVVSLTLAGDGPRSIGWLAAQLRGRVARRFRR